VAPERERVAVIESKRQLLTQIGAQAAAMVY
jgi:hypothetical protein